MDTIWQCAFGVDADSQNRIDDPYYKKCEKVFTDIADFNMLMYFGSKALKKQLILNILKIL